MDLDTQRALLDRVMAHRAAGDGTDLAPDLYRNPVDTYIDPARYAVELERLYQGCPVLACLSCDVRDPGDYVTLTIADVPVLVARGQDGVVRGFRNVCRHRGASLLPVGAGACSTIRCPYHHWVFDDHGSLVAAPHFGDDPTFRVDDWPLEPVHVDQWRGLTFVSIDPVESLTDQLGGLPDELADEPIESYTATDSEIGRAHV